jgi:hypothetical protein
LERLGILVATDEHVECLKSLLRQAGEAGVATNCFLTDKGVAALQDPGFQEAVKGNGTQLTVCEHSWDRLGLGDPIPEFNYASQYQNATMVGWAEKVLVL